MTKTETAPTKPYTFHNALFTKEANGQAIGDCPLCLKKGHFYVNLKERPNPKKPGRTIDAGAFECKHCGAAGGARQFLTKFYAQHLGNTEQQHYKKLSALRGNLPWQAFELAGMAFDGLRWILPLRNFSNEIINLYVWRPDAKKPRLMSTASISTSLYWAGDVPPPEQPNHWPIYLCEGEWDAIALEWLRREACTKKDQKIGTILAVHGANNFDQSLSKYFDGREVKLVYDKDGSGEAGVNKRAPALLSSGATAILTINWDAFEVPIDAEKWDIRDQICQDLAAKTKPAAIWDSIDAGCQPFTADPSEPEHYAPSRPKRTVETIADFDKVIDLYRGRLKLTDNMVDGIATVFATGFAGRIFGPDPLWLLLIGPPGSGKTAVIQSFMDAERCKYESTFKARALVSGSKDTSYDPSLVPQWVGNCVFIKDFTAIKSLPPMEQEEIYGLLRDISDGHFKRQFANGVVRDYSETYFSLVCGVTDVIHADQRAELGERFLKFDWIRDTKYNAHHQIMAAMRGSRNAEEGQEDLLNAATAFMQQDFNFEKTPIPPPHYEEKIAALAQLVAYIRTRRPTGKGEDEKAAYRLRSEIPTRLAVQLEKLGRCICFVWNQKKWDDRIYRLLWDVGMDTCYGQTREIFAALAKSPGNIEQLTKALRYSGGTIRRRLDDMVEVGYVCKDSEGGKKGRPPNAYYLSAETLSLYHKAIPENLK